MWGRVVREGRGSESKEDGHVMSTVTKQREDRKWGWAVKTVGPPTVIHFLQKNSTSYRCHNFPEQNHQLGQQVFKYMDLGGAFHSQTTPTRPFASQRQGTRNGGREVS